MILPASVDLNSLPSVPLSQAHSLPAIAALYFCLSNSQPLYIGITGDLNRRWQAHHKTIALLNYSDVKIHYLAIAPEQVTDNLERQFIDYWQPSLNKRSGCIQPRHTLSIDIDVENLLLRELLPLVDYENTFILNSDRKRRIAESINIKVQTINNYIQKLIDKNIISRVGRGEFQVNPNIIARGEWHQVYQKRQDWELVVTYSPKGNKTISSRPSPHHDS